MSRQFVSAALILILFAALNGCGREEESPGPGDPAGFLPDEIPAAGLVRSSEIRRFVGDSLWEYINGGAEVYHTYGFVAVTTVDYTSDEAELVTDIYRFETGDGAYGLFSSIRPPAPKILPAGVEGFITSTSADFVKGAYLCRLTAFAPSDHLAETMRSAVGTIEALLPGTTELPGSFALFPQDNGIPYSERIYAESFLGHQSLTWVHARQYSPVDDTVTLFLVSDSAETKFDRVRAALEQSGAVMQPTTELSFDEGSGLMFEHPYYGTVAIGIRGTRLAGMINVNDDGRMFLDDWLQSMDNSENRQ